MRKLIFALFVLLSMSATAADQDSQLQALLSAVNMLDQEQQAIYQQFQMVQDLRRSFLQAPYNAPLLPVPPGELPNYYDVLAAQNNAIRRDEELLQEATRLLARYDEIRGEKRALRQQILRLMDRNE